jgi:hypothetical protein
MKLTVVLHCCGHDIICMFYITRWEQSSDASSKMLLLNEIYRTGKSASGGLFKNVLVVRSTDRRNWELSRLC